jgi:hypothetical protein
MERICPDIFRAGKLEFGTREAWTGQRRPGGVALPLGFRFVQRLWQACSTAWLVTGPTLNERLHPLPTGTEALDEPFAAFPPWFMRVTCDLCGKVQMVDMMCHRPNNLTT